MTVDTLRDTKKVVGTKQVVKAVEKGQANRVFLAADADSRVTGPIRELCERLGVTTQSVPTMSELGKACGIEVGAAAVATLKG